jgi:hypothetical protein
VATEAPAVGVTAAGLDEVVVPHPAARMRMPMTAVDLRMVSPFGDKTIERRENFICAALTPPRDRDTVAVDGNPQGGSVMSDTAGTVLASRLRSGS